MALPWIEIKADSFALPLYLFYPLKSKQLPTFKDFGNQGVFIRAPPLPPPPPLYHTRMLLKGKLDENFEGKTGREFY